MIYDKCKKRHTIAYIFNIIRRKLVYLTNTCRVFKPMLKSVTRLVLRNVPTMAVYTSRSNHFTERLCIRYMTMDVKKRQQIIQ